METSITKAHFAIATSVTEAIKGEVTNPRGECYRQEQLFVRVNWKILADNADELDIDVGIIITLPGIDISDELPTSPYTVSDGDVKTKWLALAGIIAVEEAKAACKVCLLVTIDETYFQPFELPQFTNMLLEVERDPPPARRRRPYPPTFFPN